MLKAVMPVMIVLAAVLTSTVYAQTYEVPTELRQLQLQGTQLNSPTNQVDRNSVQTESQPQISNQADNQYLPTQEVKSLQKLFQSQQGPGNKYLDNEKIVNWLGLWWRISFLVGIIWFLVWIFVGWQWTKFKFWGFGWPWPWWFWIPLFWFIPWLIIAWQWWLVWWVWWIWIWAVFPWIFWLVWWTIIFKEIMVSFWRKK